MSVHPSLSPVHLRPLVTPRRIIMRNLRQHCRSLNLHLLILPVQQSQTPDLPRRARRRVAGRFGFFAAVGGLEGCDFGCLGITER